MKVKLLAVGILAAMSASSFGQLPVSETVAVLPIELATGFNGVAIPYSSSPTLSGTVSSVSGTTVTLDQSSAGIDSTFSIRFTSGENSGLVRGIASASGSTVTIVDSIAWSVSDDGYAGYEIVKNPTLNSAFGADNRAGFTAAAVSGSANNIFAPSGFGLATFFYNSSTSQWEDVSAPGVDAGDTIIGGLNGFVAVLNLGAPVTITVSGVDDSTKAGFSITGLGFFAGTLPFPEASTLGTSGLENSLVGAGTPGSADQVYIPSGFGLDGFFFNTSAAEWQTLAGANADATVLPKGGGFFVLKLVAGTRDFIVEEDL